MPTINRLEDLGEAVIEVFGDYKNRTAEVIYEKLTEPGGTPVKTGTLRANWKAAPGKTGSDTRFIPNTGENREAPARFDTSKYLRNWKMFTIRNNSPYVIHVNNGISGNGHNANFIQAALQKADDEMESYIAKRK